MSAVSAVTMQAMTISTSKKTPPPIGAHKITESVLDSVGVDAVDIVGAVDVVGAVDAVDVANVVNEDSDLDNNSDENGDGVGKVVVDIVDVEVV